MPVAIRTRMQAPYPTGVRCWRSPVSPVWWWLQVAEAFPWSAGASVFAHPAAVHNSVLGVRGPAAAAGAAVRLVDTQQLAAAAGEAAGAAAAHGAYGSAGQEAVAAAGGTGDTVAAAAGAGCCYSLLALPAECNFTGDRHPGDLGALVTHVQRHGIAGLEAAGGGSSSSSSSSSTCSSSSASEAPSSAGSANTSASAGGSAGGGGQWLVLLDAAKACSTHPPDLSAVPADFVVLSYYKIFGHPTGLGALVLRREALALLGRHKAYWGGGTVEVAVADRPFQVRCGGGLGGGGGGWLGGGGGWVA
jgi:molybdenum cofactor sulfurtransferase